MIHMIIVLINQLRNRHKGVSFIFQGSDESVQRLGCEFCPIVAKNDAAVSKMLVLGHGLYDGIYAIVFPVKGISIIHSSKDNICMFLIKYNSANRKQNDSTMKQGDSRLHPVPCGTLSYGRAVELFPQTPKGA